MKTLLFTVILTVMGVAAIAQTTIGGKILDVETNEPLIGVNVVVYGTYKGTTTNADGVFSLTLDKSPPYELVISYVGYESQNIEVSSVSTDLIFSMMSKMILGNEVVITAQLREQELQEVPIAITVISANSLKNNPSVTKLNDIFDYVPGLSGGDFTGGSIYNIRGISSGIFNNTFENSVGIFQENVFAGRISAAGNEFYDIERIEVLKGPQGTLFGRNTAAGAISIIQNKPKVAKDLSFGLTVGNEGQLVADYVLNVPISDKFRFRLAGKYQQRDPLVLATDPDTGIETGLSKTDFLGNRLSLQYVGEKFLGTLLLSYSQSDRGGTANVSTSALLRDGLGVPIPSDPYTRTINQNGPPRDVNNNLGATLLLNWYLNDNLTFESITGYRKNDLDYRFDPDASEFPVAMFENPDKGNSITQEFRLKAKSEKVDWLAALSLFNESSEQTAVLEADASVLDFLFAGGALGLAPELSRETHVHNATILSGSVYSDATVHLSDKVDLTGGVRFSYDKKEVHYQADLSSGAFQQAIGANVLTVDYFAGGKDTTVVESWNAIQPRLNLSFKASDNVMIFGGYSMGYKPGGLNDYNLRVVKPETNNAYEIGLKTSFAEKKGMLNISGFLYDYKDLQVLQVVNATIGANNAGDVESKGVEVEASYMLTKEFSVSGNLALIDAKYKNFITDAGDYSGNKTLYTPDMTWRLNAQYSKKFDSGVSFYLQADYNFTSEIFFHEDNRDELKSPAYSLLNATAGLSGIFGGKIDTGVFATNITDVNYVVNARDDLGDLPYITRGNPRYFGVFVKVNNILNW